MTHINSIEQLNTSAEKTLFRLEILRNTIIDKRIEELSIVDFGELSGREQITCDRLEERYIIDGEFGNVDIHQGSQANNIFRVIDHHSLEITSCCENGLDCSHTKVIMVLT